MIKIGNADIVNIYIGDSAATAVYVGNDLVWPTGGHDYTQDYFTIKMLGSDTITWNRADLYYSLNGGEWTAWDASNGLAVQNDDEIRFKGTAVNNGNAITNSNANFKAYGNVMSLRYGDNFSGQTLADNKSFSGLFNANTKLIDAENLWFPATDVTGYSFQGAYSGAFGDCTGLVKGPKFKPFTIIGSGYYAAYGMFWKCTALESVGDIDVTKGAAVNYALESFFNGCVSLRKSPKITFRLASGQTHNNNFLNIHAYKYHSIWLLLLAL